MVPVAVLELVSECVAMTVKVSADVSASLPVAITRKPVLGLDVLPAASEMVVAEFT
jgi:hypothetical protein